MYLLLSSALNTAGLFDRDVEQVSNMKEGMRSHLVHQTKVIQGSANSALSVPHKAIGFGTWLLLRQALHVYVIQRDSKGRARTSR